jgi:hypothetical protein
MKNSALASNASSGGGNGHRSSGEAERVRELIAGRHTKAALQLAKDLHKRDATADLEALLVDAYRARIEDLLKLRMTAEAKALFAIVRERFPAALPRLADIDWELCALEGRFDEIVAPLRDANLAATDRERIETFIRQRVDDLPALAAVSSLPPEHPVRTAAAALASALQAVTEGPVDHELLALPQVPRRSPLASWKALVRAIACYHCREDAECRKWLLTIADDSVPARAIPALNAMLGGMTKTRFGASETRLIRAAGDQVAALGRSLATLESALLARKKEPILDAAPAVAAACAGCDAVLRERLRQHIAVRCLMRDIPTRAIAAALGGPPQRDAYFFRLMARALEEAGSMQSSADAVMLWEAFRRAAIRERWFAAGGLEDGVLSLYMAQLVAKLPPYVVEEMEDLEEFYRRPGKVRSDEEFPTPEQLFERACKADPSAEAFQDWLSWASKHRSWKVADDVAERWRKARPGEIQPLIHLMESAEKRNALKKSLKYLEEAEALDRLNPTVRLVKARLLVFAALRHLREGKTHLVSAEIERLSDVPTVRPGEIFALAAALGWCCAAIERDDAAQQARETELAGSIGPVAAHLLMLAVNRSAALSSKLSPPPPDATHTSAAELLAEVVRACLLGKWSGLRIPLRFGWTGKLIKELQQPSGSVDDAQLLVLGEAALSDSVGELAYALSAAGLARGNANARFLFLRARALPLWADVRREGCFKAALELARRERDTDLAGRILDQLNGRTSGSFGWFVDDSPEIARWPIAPELLNAILDEELKFKSFPAVPRDNNPRYGVQLAETECDCPKCRAKRGEPVGDGGDEHDEDEQEEDLDVFGPTGTPKMPALAKPEKNESTTPPQPSAQRSLF